MCSRCGFSVLGAGGPSSFTADAGAKALLHCEGDPTHATAVTSRFRLTIVSGFPGVGKTTWLRQQILDGAFRRQLILVDETAAFAVDDALLSGDHRIEVLADGCVCCAGRERLIAWLTEKCAAPARGEASVEHFVLATSGLADPTAIVAAIRGDPLLSSVLTVGEVVVLVDAESGLRRLASEALCRTQVGAADCLIVTKLDAADADAVPVLLATLKALNPVAPIFGSARGVEAALPPHDAAAFLPQDASWTVPAAQTGIRSSLSAADSAPKT